MLFKQKGSKILLARLLVTILCLSNIFTFSSMATQSQFLGTNAALGSPLMSDAFTIEDWNQWEMLCFGIFLSNFCQPFEDDYYSAFTEGATQGSKGRGIEALKFSSGGDATANGYLADMLNYCIESQTQSYKPIYVSYDYYEYNQKVGTDNMTGAARQAYFDDLIPMLGLMEEDTDSLLLYTNDKIINPLVAYKVFKGTTTGAVVEKTYVEYAILPTFYAKSSKDENYKIFSLTDNWDIQILKALFAKAFNKYGATDYVFNENTLMGSLEDTFSNYLNKNIPLVLDTYGNICMTYGGRQIIIIPASTNQYLTKETSYNYLNSLILNNYVLSGTEADIVLNSQEDPIDVDSKGVLFWKEFTSALGNFPVSHNDNLEDGKILITSDTDSYLMSHLYKKLVEVQPKDTSVQYNILDDTQSGEASFAYSHGNYGDILGDFTFGESIYKLLDEDSIKNQALQIHVTGAVSYVDEVVGHTGFFNTKDVKRESTDISLDSTYGAYGLLSTLFAEDGVKANILDYFYEYESSKTLEQAKVNIFSESYYLSPSFQSESENVNQLYSNYYFKTLADKGLIATELNDVYNDSVRDELVNNLKKQSVFDFVWISMLTSEDISENSILMNNYTNSRLDFEELKASPIYKSFLNRYYKQSDMFSQLLFKSNDTTILNIDTFYNLSETNLGDDYGIEGHIPSNVNPVSENFTRLVKVYKPTSTFKALASIFGLSEGCQFELYSPYIYITYLDFYGLLGGNNNHKFNEKIFESGYFKSFTGEDFTNGLTKEEMEDQVKFNVYKLLSLNDDGAEYRKLLFESLIRTTFVEPLDEKMNSSGVGNVGSETSFLDVNSIEENFLIGDIIKEYWSTLSLILFGILSLIAVVSGALNNKTISWYLTILVASSSMVYAIPYYLDIAPTIIEKYINSTYNVTGSYWALAESIEFDKNQHDLMSSTDEGVKAVAMLNNLNFLDTDSSLMIKLDISQKVLNKTAIDTNDLQRLTTTRWLLPSLMKQMSATDDNYDYVSVPVTRVYDNFSKIWIMYHGESDNEAENPVYPDGEKAEDVNLSDIDQCSIWYGDKKTNRRYKNTVPANTQFNDYTGSISKINNNSELTHTKFYFMKDNNFKSAYDTMEKSYMTKQDWKEYANKVASKDALVIANSFGTEATNLLSYLNNFNQYQDKIIQEMGYLWTTENLGTYFYTLVKDTFDEGGSGSALNTSSILLQLQGGTSTNVSGDYVRTSFMHYMETGYERDVCDMEEVFTNLMPYMYQTMILANGNSNNNGLLGTQKMVGHPYYSDNYLSWLYRCNWVTKIYEDNLYSSSGKTVSRDEDGNITGEYEIPNICDPRSYPDERPMVFSEAQMHKQSLREEDLTYTEIKILEFNSNVITRWTSLINYANTSGLTKEHIYRQMAMDALFAFNETFTRDNIIMTEKTLYPQNYDLRSISLITILRSLISNLTNNASFASGNLADKVYTSYGFPGYLSIFMIYYLLQIFGVIRECFTIAAFICSLITLAFNFGSTSKNKFKALGGWAMTSVMFCTITMIYYFFINFLIGDPTPDSLIILNHISSNRLFNIPLIFWAIIILLMTFAYGGIIVYYFYQLFIGHKFGLNIRDGGFAFYYNLADKATSAMVNATRSVGNKFGKTFGNLKNWGPGADGNSSKKKKEDVDTQNVKHQNSESSSKNKNKNKDNDLSGQQGLNGNFNNGTYTSGDNAEFTSDANKRIRESKKQASIENSKRVDINESNTVINNSTNINIENNTNSEFTSEAEKRISDDAKKKN